MSTDPTGYEDALALVPKGQLSERQMRIAAAVAAVRDGESQQSAAKRFHVPQSTLWRYVHGLSQVGQEEAFDVDHKAIRAATYDIAQTAAECIQKSLSETPDDWKPGDLVKAYGVAVDKIAVLSQRDGAQTGGISELVSALLEQGDVTVTKRDPSREAVDVTPSGEGGE